ncbi:sensor histidine kinase [Peredibacter starrii]|uniref:histidine kinase n=1 Tax=Peredibacter starrii TaxID=28202 RepID=A0AAX4HUW6_9BACT|nr:HAMP domain-containing sensor histidine kinase [Peredibacter starrii]WPU67031.1 HAMP domain-containing sensor histidine kinase [Peredibacter starrii]
MQLKKIPALGWYFTIYNFVSYHRVRLNDIDRRQIHSQIVTVLCTGVLMWSYAILASFTISSPVPGIIGLICSLVHLFSPLLFRVTNNTYFISNVLLGAGIIHQSTFTYYTGGFTSNILIWFGVLPLIGGVICAQKGAITWSVTSSLVAFGFFILHLIGYECPNLISETGFVWSHALLVFGWVFISTTLVVVYAGLRQHTEELLQKQSQKIDDLFRVLFHDLANPLGRIAIGLSLAKKQIPEGENSRGLEIATQASEAMLEITQNIRKMYAVSKGKANVDLTMVSLNSAVEYVTRVFSNELERKHLAIEYHWDKNAGLNVLVEPISFNNQVLGNIISNAIKFSPIGSKIVINAYPVNQGSYAIEIKDSGIGIPTQLIKGLFDINKKTSRPGTMGEIGTGFGMHIMKSFVEMYGGQVVVESIEAQGDAPSGTTVKLILKGEWT